MDQDRGVPAGPRQALTFHCRCHDRGTDDAKRRKRLIQEQLDQAEAVHRPPLQAHPGGVRDHSPARTLRQVGERLESAGRCQPRGTHHLQHLHEGSFLGQVRDEREQRGHDGELRQPAQPSQTRGECRSQVASRTGMPRGSRWAMGRIVEQPVEATAIAVPGALIAVNRVRGEDPAGGTGR